MNTQWPWPCLHRYIISLTFWIKREMLTGFYVLLGAMADDTSNTEKESWQYYLWAHGFVLVFILSLNELISNRILKTELPVMIANTNSFSLLLLIYMYLFNPIAANFKSLDWRHYAFISWRSASSLLNFVLVFNRCSH